MRRGFRCRKDVLEKLKSAYDRVVEEMYLQ